MKDFQSLVARIKNAESRLGISRHGAWFRGHYDRTWKLSPLLFRYTNGASHERNIFSSFCTESPVLRSDGKHDLQILARMQHFGTPTRLLDWTESLSTALFFATIFPMRRQVGSPAIWLLNPFRLNFSSTGKNVIYDNTDILRDATGKEVPYFECIRDKKWPFDLPVAMYSPFANERIRAQKGAFTIHGNDIRSLEEQTPNAVKRIDIPDHLVGQIREHLIVSGVSFHTLFPDDDGLGRAIRHRFKLY